MVNLLLVSCRFHIYCSVDVLLGVLDMAEERDGQPIVWGIQWTRDGAPNIRLGSNHVGWKSVDDSLVGTPEHIWELRRDPVDRGPHCLLYQRQ